MNINLKKHNKQLIVLMLASVLLTSAFVGIAFAFKSGISATNTDFMVFEGTAGNDYYDGRQYSFQVNQWAYGNAPSYDGSYPAENPANWWFNANKSLRIGMTEYGEFATPTNTNAGIAYGYNSAEWAQTESWASTAVDPKLYIQGWVFYMNYTRAAINRAIEAYALYSDTSTTESARKVYSWDGDYNPSSSGAGKVTEGSLTTSGVEVLYDSARLAVGRTTVVIRDGNYSEDVAKVTLTVVFNKDTKYAIIYKDVKILLDPKVLDLIKDISFGERYEIDLARNINPSNQAYIHYFADYDGTVYQHPLTGQDGYDVVQAFNPDRNYTYFAGYWPMATEYAVYSPLIPNVPGGFTRILNSSTAIADIPAPPNGPGEASTPWVIAQWRYNNTMWPELCNFLAKDGQREIRFVEVAGMTDYNKGQPADFRAMDINASDPVNYVDVEIQYLLNQVFNPEDLKNAWDDPFMWIGVGQPSQAVDSAGAAFLADYGDYSGEPMPFFDKAEPALGTIPYGLTNMGNFGNYVEGFSNSLKTTGTDTTMYYRNGLLGFAFMKYDNVTAVPAQPIAGGNSSDGPDSSTKADYWYPSKNPLDERYAYNTAGTTCTLSPYDSPWDSDNNGIITVGGPKANQLSRYFNDFNFAIDREGASAYALVNGGSVTGTAPTSNVNVTTFDFFPVSTWASSMSTFNYKAGYAVISVARDINGTRGLSVYGWDGRDTFWAAAWADQYIGTFPYWLPDGCTAIILQMTYPNANSEPTAFTVVKALGTITEFGYNRYNGVYLDIGWTGYLFDTSQVPITFTAEDVGEGYDGNVWWWEKVPTTITATVQFDP
jgi:hypothetical protein